ncbi:MAG: hypothetical protein QXG39_02545 [Candidatus Aenigmatarchaeota archaeon]
MKGQMNLYAILITIFTLIVFLAITPVIRELIGNYYHEMSPVEKFLISLVIPAIFIGILSMIILYSKPYYYEGVR